MSTKATAQIRVILNAKGSFQLVNSTRVTPPEKADQNRKTPWLDNLMQSIGGAFIDIMKQRPLALFADEPIYRGFSRLQNALGF